MILWFNENDELIFDGGLVFCGECPCEESYLYEPCEFDIAISYIYEPCEFDLRDQGESYIYELCEYDIPAISYVYEPCEFDLS
jgi:hypothetical protein